MEGHCSTGQSPQWAVVPMEEEECRAGQATDDDAEKARFACRMTKAGLSIRVHNI